MATMTRSARTVALPGRVLFLTADAGLLEAQLAGAAPVDINHDPERVLMANISTDEITPGWVCYYYDETLGRYCLVGLRGGVVKPDAVRNGGFSVVVSGMSKGCGSSPEAAPASELPARILPLGSPRTCKISVQQTQD